MYLLAVLYLVEEHGVSIGSGAVLADIVSTHSLIHKQKSFACHSEKNGLKSF